MTRHIHSIPIVRLMPVYKTISEKTQSRILRKIKPTFQKEVLDIEKMQECGYPPHVIDQFIHDYNNISDVDYDVQSCIHGSLSVESTLKDFETSKNPHMFISVSLDNDDNLCVIWECDCTDDGICCCQNSKEAHTLDD